MSSKDLPYREALTKETEERLVSLYNQYSDIDELWGLYGEAIVGPAATGEPPIEPGKKSFNRILHQYKAALCNDKRIQAFLDDDQTGDILSLAMVFTAKLASEQFAGIDVCAAGLLIARIGLRKICEMERIE